MKEMELFPAKWWKKCEDNAVQCLLCPRMCRMKEGQTGFCAVRKNVGGNLYSQAYGYLAALQIDPIEKKPLRHFLPGTRTFSIGTLGCNLKCLYCQNHHLSRNSYDARKKNPYYTPDAITDLILRHGCESISYTYNEPGVFGEYVMDCARTAAQKGLKNILVSNGYITREAALEIYPLMDAANFDVKGFSEEYYAWMCSGKLQTVKESVELFRNTCSRHAELTYLVVPGKNDHKEMIDAYLDWVENALGIETPIHFTAYHPDYLYSESIRTPRPLLDSLLEYAKEERKFPNVYLGNIC